MRKLVAAIALTAAVTTGCASTKGVDTVTDFISKDIALEDQQLLLEKYTGEYAWTRIVLEDLNESETPGEPKKRVAPRDTKIEIVTLNFAYSGAITVIDTRRRKITHGLDVDRPDVSRVWPRRGRSGAPGTGRSGLHGRRARSSW